MSSTFGFPWRGLLSHRNNQGRGRTRTARARRRGLVPRLDALEDRRLLSLIPSPDGLTVYDTKTGMNWLANTDLAADPQMHLGVEGINPDGSMTWETAMNWVAALNNADYLGHDDWILPVTPPTDPNASL
jgi:hypothetical protein